MLMRLILGPFWVGAGISILEYYDIVGENIRNRSPNNSNRPRLAKNWRKPHEKKGRRSAQESFAVILVLCKYSSKDCKSEQ